MNDMDNYSFQCGVIDCCNELLSRGVKTLALSRPVDNAAGRDALLAFSMESCRAYGTKLYPEDDPLLTDLFPLSRLKGKFLLLFYQMDHVLEQYIRLREKKDALVAEGAYFGGNRSRIAWEYGRLLSYSDEIIRKMLQENTEKEVVSA